MDAPARAAGRWPMCATRRQGWAPGRNCGCSRCRRAMRWRPGRRTTRRRWRRAVCRRWNRHWSISWCTTSAAPFCSGMCERIARALPGAGAMAERLAALRARVTGASGGGRPWRCRRSLRCRRCWRIARSAPGLPTRCSQFFTRIQAELYGSRAGAGRSGRARRLLPGACAAVRSHRRRPRGRDRTGAGAAAPGRGIAPHRRSHAGADAGGRSWSAACCPTAGAARPARSRARPRRRRCERLAGRGPARWRHGGACPFGDLPAASAAADGGAAGQRRRRRCCAGRPR